ncbi:MAG: preprotein translocase subunit YajC, partial [Chitinispirillaceae bacterium]
GQAPQQPGGNFFTGVLPMMLVMFAIIYFLMIRPEQKKQKDRQKMIDAIKKGDKVLTIGGITGTVSNIKGTMVNLKIAENTTVEVTKSAISSVIDEKAGNGKEKNA